MFADEGAGGAAHWAAPPASGGRCYAAPASVVVVLFLVWHDQMAAGQLLR